MVISIDIGRLDLDELRELRALLYGLGMTKEAAEVNKQIVRLRVSEGGNEDGR